MMTGPERLATIVVCEPIHSDDDGVVAAGGGEDR